MSILTHEQLGAHLDAILRHHAALRAEPDPEPEPDPDPDPEPDPEPDPVPDYPGQPEPGTVLWGSSIHGGGDPYPRHEQQAGVPLALRRTFFQWHHRTGRGPSTAAEDLTVGRLPWISYKTPPWAEMADGTHDDTIDEMLSALADLDGPVWLTIHHEPEGGGGDTSGEPADDPAGPAGHLGMNRRVRERMDALNVGNVALVPVFMGWTWDARSGRDIEEWWDDGVYDFLGIDIYQRTEGPEVADVPSWEILRQWAAGKGMDVAVGEWGMRGDDQAAGDRVRRWHAHATGSDDDGQGGRVVGLSAFDSGLNSPSGSWELRGGQLEAFRELLTHPDTARLPHL